MIRSEKSGFFMPFLRKGEADESKNTVTGRMHNGSENNRNFINTRI